MQELGRPDAGDGGAKISARGWRGEPVRSRVRWRLPALVLVGLLVVAGVAATTRLIDAASPEVDLPIAGRLALLPFLNVTSDRNNDWVEIGLMEMVAEALTGTAGAAVVSPVRLRKAFEPRGLDLHDPQARERARSLAFTAGADQVLEVKVRQREQGTVLHVELFDPSGVLATASLEGSSPLAVAEDLVFSVGRGLTSGMEPRNIRQLFSRSEFLDRLYATGLSELRVADPETARPYFEIALKHRPGFFQARAKLAECAQRSGDLEGAREMTSQWLREAQARGERRSQAQGLRALALLAAFENDLGKSSELYQQAFAIHLDMADEPARADVLFELARLALAEDDSNRAEELYVERLGIQQSLGDRLGEADSMFQIGSLLLARKDLDGAGQVLEDARDLAVQIGDVWTEMRAVTSLGEIAHLQGEVETAKTLWRRALTFYDQRAENPRRLLLSYKMVEALVRSEEFDEAEDRLHEILELSRSLEDRPFEAKATIGLAWLLLRTGYPFQAKPHLDRALELDRWLDNRVMLQLVIAWYAYETGSYRLAANTQLEVKKRSPERWAPFDEAFLQVFQQAVVEGRRLPLPGEEDYIPPG